MFPPNDGRFPLLNRQFEGNSSRFPRKSKRNSAISKCLTLLWCRLSDGHLRNLAREADQCRRGHVVIVPRQRRVYTSIAFNRKFKWHSSFHRKVSKKDGNLQTYSSFPVPTGMTGKSLYCTISKLPLGQIHLGPFSRLSLQIFQNGYFCSEAMHVLWSNFAEHLRIPKSWLYRWVNNQFWESGCPFL